MPRAIRRTAVLVVLVALTALTTPIAAQAAPQDRGDTRSYIVVFNDDSVNARAEAQRLANRHGGSLGFVYQHALKGFSLAASPRAAAALARNPNVAYVEADRQVSISDQVTPTGVERIFAEDTALDIDSVDDKRVDVDVAVIDTGIDFEHPDLNVVGGVVCQSKKWFRPPSCKSGGDDDHYHGTHVAGTIGALDNDQDVVGVAPGARLWAVKVLDRRGSGRESEVVAGIDWVAGNADTIEVANMSLGGPGDSRAEYDAIQGAVEAGVAFAVAAGNNSDDASEYSPAAFGNVLTVSALADFDGLPGGLGAASCRTDEDDTLANFSNYGSAVDIAAPGVCITSTFPLEEGGLGTISGTSMASPHVAGALALLASTDDPLNASDVYGLYDTVISNGNYDWTDDSRDGIKEPLLDISGSAFVPTLAANGDSGSDPPPDPDPEGLTLSATGYKVKGVQHADLSWEGTSSAVDVYRDGGFIDTDDNGSPYSDNVGGKGGGDATYQVCETGTETCSDKVTVVW